MSLIASFLGAIFANSISSNRRGRRELKEAKSIIMHGVDAEDAASTKASRERVLARPDCFSPWNRAGKMYGYWYPDRIGHPILKEYCYKDEWIQFFLESRKHSFSFEELQGWAYTWGKDIYKEVKDYCDRTGEKLPYGISEKTFRPTGMDNLRTTPYTYYKETQRERMERTGKYEDVEGFLLWARFFTDVCLLLLVLCIVLELLPGKKSFTPFQFKFWVSCLIGCPILMWIISLSMYFDGKRAFEKEQRIKNWKPGDPRPK